jgi:hypothetical protein
MVDITKLPIDFKGTLASNLRTGEEHVLNKANGRVNRMFTPDFGAFYTESLVVRTAAGVPLIRDQDYVVTYYYPDLGELSSKEVCAIIVITNPAISNTVRITYQAVGGPYALSIKELKVVLDETEAAPEKIKWTDIVNKPLQFTPDPDHTHEYWQLYGLESTNVNLDLLGKAWEKGRKSLIDENRIYYQNYILLAQAAVDAYRLKVQAHITDKDNPHQTDKIKIQLGNVQNWPLATTAESTTKTVNNRYQPIGGIYNQLDAHVQPLLTAHIANKANPHQVLLTDPLLNLYSTQEIQNIFALRLHNTQKAVDSARFAGLAASTVWSNIRNGLDASNVDPNTRFTEPYFGPTVPGWDPSLWVLAGNQRYAYIPDVLAPYNAQMGSIFFAGNLNGRTDPAGAREAIRLKCTDGNVGNGSWVIGQYYRDYNGGRTLSNLMVGVKTGYGTFNEVF